MGSADTMRKVADESKPAPRRRRVTVSETAYGLGVFANRRFRSGEIIGTVNGRIIEAPDDDSRYSIDVEIGILDPDAPFRFLNHSCEPNCRLLLPPEGDPSYVRRRPWVKVEALREIAVGEQLTIDYAWPADAAIPCGCLSPICRGWIVDAAELTQVPQQAF